MKKKLSLLLGLCAAVCFAQDVAITNTRIIVGNGTVVPSGTIIVRGGKIVSAGAGKADTKGLKYNVDAKGMSALPGYIDAHKHINTGPEREGADAIAARGGLHDYLVGRRAGGWQHCAAGSH